MAAGGAGLACLSHRRQHPFLRYFHHTAGEQNILAQQVVLPLDRLGQSADLCCAAGRRAVVRLNSPPRAISRVRKGGIRIKKLILGSKS